MLNYKIIVQIVRLAWNNGAATSRQCDVYGRGWARWRNAFIKGVLVPRLILAQRLLQNTLHILTQLKLLMTKFITFSPLIHLFATIVLRHRLLKHCCSWTPPPVSISIYTGWFPVDLNYNKYYRLAKTCISSYYCRKYFIWIYHLRYSLVAANLIDGKVYFIEPMPITCELMWEWYIALQTIKYYIKILKNTDNAVF